MEGHYRQFDSPYEWIGALLLPGLGAPIAVAVFRWLPMLGSTGKTFKFRLKQLGASRHNDQSVTCESASNLNKRVRFPSPAPSYFSENGPVATTDINQARSLQLCSRRKFATPSAAAKICWRIASSIRFGLPFRRIERRTSCPELGISM